MQGKCVLLLLGSLILITTLPSLRFKLIKLEASDNYPVHNLNTGLNYMTIQEAMDAIETEDGHVIFAEEGTYYEHVTILKSISLIGQEREITIVDGNSTGTVILITASNVSVINFTIRNAGKVWYGTGYPPSCISGNNIKYVDVENNTLTDAAVCLWFHSSSFVNISDDIVSNARTAGIIGYASSNIMMHHNLVDNCGSMGLHLDGSSTDCNIINNTIMNTTEGIEVEKSAENFVVGNRLIGNNASIVLNQCGGSNSFRENNMANNWYNLVVWGWALEAFMQDIDTSNIVNNRTVYYLINSQNLLINPSHCPNLGYLAIVNCHDMTIKDIDLSFNRDGLLLAQSTNCNLVNITLSGNFGPLLYGGLTFFKSNSNLIVNNKITNNSVAACLYQSNENTFYHNSFVDNKQQVIPNFNSPFSPPSDSSSVNMWNSSFEGNYWSNYTGADLDHDGVGDAPHTVDGNNTDNYPLMGMFYGFAVMWQEKTYAVNVISNSTVSNLSLLTWLTSPTDVFRPGQPFIHFFATGENGSGGFCRLMIPRTVLNSSSYIVLVDSNPINATGLPLSNSTNVYLYFTYTHSTHGVIVTIPEFAPFLMLPLTMIATLLAVTVYKRKQRQLF